VDRGFAAQREPAARLDLPRDLGRELPGEDLAASAPMSPKPYEQSENLVLCRGGCAYRVCRLERIDEKIAEP